jgi:hypothetical protein
MGKGSGFSRARKKTEKKVDKRRGLKKKERDGTVS